NAVENPKSIFLRLPGSHDHVHLVGGSIKGILSEMVGDEQELYLLELAVCEAVTNSIKHAYKEASGNYVELELIISEAELIFKIKDKGRSLAEGILRNRKIDEESICANTCEGGRGIPLIKEIMDQVYYHSDDKENCLTMIKRM
ncbi:MAG: ATP-binding protein, partial [Desulfonatronovibrio sp.]